MISSDWRSQIFLKKLWRPEFELNRSKSGPKLGFCHFLKFCSLVFLEIVYNDSLQQCLTSSIEIRSTKKNLEPKCESKGPKLGLKLGFLSFSQVLFISFPLNCIEWYLRAFKLRSANLKYFRPEKSNFQGNLSHLSRTNITLEFLIFTRMMKRAWSL